MGTLYGPMGWTRIADTNGECEHTTEADRLMQIDARRTYLRNRVGIAGSITTNNNNNSFTGSGHSQKCNRHCTCSSCRCASRLDINTITKTRIMQMNRLEATTWTWMLRPAWFSCSMIYAQDCNYEPQTHIVSCMFLSRTKMRIKIYSNKWYII